MLETTNTNAAGLSRPIDATENMTANVGSMIYKAPEVGTTTPYTETSDLCVERPFARVCSSCGAE